MQPNKDSPYRLLVEGQDDKHTIISLLNRHEVGLPFVENYEGVDNLLGELPVLLKSDAYRRIGILLDADLNIERRWKQLQGRFIAAGLTLPHDPGPGGTNVEGLYPNQRIGI